MSTPEAPGVGPQERRRGERIINPSGDQRAKAREVIERLMDTAIAGAHGDEDKAVTAFFHAFDLELLDGALIPGLLVRVLYGHLHEAPARQLFRRKTAPPPGPGAGRGRRARAAGAGGDKDRTGERNRSGAAARARTVRQARLWLDEIRVNGQPLRAVTGGEARTYAAMIGVHSRFIILVAEQVPDERVVGDVVNDEHAEQCMQAVQAAA